MVTARRFLNWRPTLEVRTMNDVLGYDPWASFPESKKVLRLGDVPALEAAIQGASDDYQRKELAVMKAIVEAGGLVSRMDVQRGCDAS